MTGRHPFLHPKAGFDWGRVAWGQPDSPQSAICSYCCGGMGAEDEVPLLLMKEDGSVAQFCRPCQEKWWGVKIYDGGEEQ